MSLGFPIDPPWSAEADFLELLADHCQTNKPELIVECGSGLSTLVLARCCQINGSGRVISLENNKRSADSTRLLLEQYKLKNSSVFYAPLCNYVVNGEVFPWYSSIEACGHEIEMLVVDGPAGFIHHHARFPALPLLRARLHSLCTVYLDDSARTEEREIAERWLVMYPEFKHRYHELSRGCTSLSLRPSQGNISLSKADNSISIAPFIPETGFIYT